MPSVPGFAPSTSAPLFGNGPWPAGLDLRLAVGGLPAVSVDVTAMGLCGGMSFLARDIHEAGTPQPAFCESRGVPLAVGRHVVRRQVDSFLGHGVIPRWLGATAGLDHATWFWGPGLYADTVSAAREAMASVDEGTLCPVGVVMAQSPWPWGVFANHVELVYGYDLAGTRLALRVYDPNLPGRDDLTISLDIGTRAPAKPVWSNATCGNGTPGRVRGFFVLPYEARDPAPVYASEARAGSTLAP